MTWLPVCMSVMAGSWLIASVCMERMKQMSSAHLPRLGQQFGVHPHAALAVLRELELRGRDGEAAWPLVMVVRRWPLRMRVRQVLVVPLLHLRLVVEEVHLRRATDHVQVDDALRLGREVRRERPAESRPSALRIALPSREASAA